MNGGARRIDNPMFSGPNVKIMVSTFTSEFGSGSVSKHNELKSIRKRRTNADWKMIFQETKVGSLYKALGI